MKEYHRVPRHTGAGSDGESGTGSGGFYKRAL